MVKNMTLKVSSDANDAPPGVGTSYRVKLHKKFDYHTLKVAFLMKLATKKLLGVCDDGMGKQHGTRRDSNNY
jgi:hypothetical protein